MVLNNSASLVLIAAEGIRLSTGKLSYVILPVCGKSSIRKFIERTITPTAPYFMASTAPL